MFIRQKNIKGKPRFYLVENYRQDGKVKQKVLAYLGECQTVSSAISSIERWIKNNTDRLNRYAAKIQELEDWHERTLREIAAKHSKEYIPRPFPKAERGSSGAAYDYRNYKNRVESLKKQIYKAEQTLDKLRVYVVPKTVQHVTALGTT